MTTNNLPPAPSPFDPQDLNALGDLLEAKQKARAAQDDRTLDDVFRSALRTDPAAEVEAQQLAKTLQVPREALPENLDRVREDAKLREFADLRSRMTDLGLRERMKDVQLVRLLHDDLGSLKTTVDTFDWWFRNYEAGEAINEAGALKAKQAFARHTGGALTPAELDRLTELEQIQQFAAQETGFLDETAKLLGQMVTPALRSLAGGAATTVASGALGSPLTAGTAFTVGSMATMAAQSAVTEFGHQYATIYEQLIADNVPPDEAHDTALVTAGAYGIGAAAAETLGFGAVAKSFKAAGVSVGRSLLGLARPTTAGATGTFLKETALGFAGEVGTEGVQELMGAAAQNLAASMTKTEGGPTLEEALRQAGQVMLTTAKGMAVLAPIGPTLHYAADLRRVQQAQKTQELFTRLAETAKTSEAAKRSPETFAQVVAAQTEGTPVESVFIEAPKLAQALAETGQSREQLARDLPEVAKQLEAAERTGDEVEIPMGDFAAKIAGTTLYPALRKSLRFRDGFSLERAEAWVSEQAKNREETARSVAEASAKVADWEQQSARVEQRILGEIRKDTRIEATRAQQLATLHRQWVEAQAAREGTTPEAFDAQHRLKIEVMRPQTTERRMFEQAGEQELPDNLREWQASQPAGAPAGRSAPLWRRMTPAEYEALQSEGKLAKPLRATTDLDELLPRPMAPVAEDLDDETDASLPTITAAETRRLMKALTPAEQKKLGRGTAEKIIAHLSKLPSATEMAAVAEAGKAKRGWYRKSADALVAVFQGDAPRFAALLAALSPQTSVESNLSNALRTWINWNAAGRPLDRAAITAVLGRSVQGNKGEDSVLDAWINNSISALTAEDPSAVVLSGPKVNSFFRNLIGDTMEVTNDAWMANFALVDQKMFAGKLNAKRTEPGKRAGYLAMNVVVREAAAKLTALSGQTWTPAEVQETVWSWAKTLYELQTPEKGAVEQLLAGELTDERIAATPDFGSLFLLPEYAGILGDAYGQQLAALRGGPDGTGAAQQPAQEPGAGGEATAFTAEARRKYELRGARRLERLAEQRAAEKRRSELEKAAEEFTGLIVQLRPGTRDGAISRADVVGAWDAKSGARVGGRLKQDALPAEAPKRELVALHNLTEDQLLASIRLGGFPAPSIGVARAAAPYSDFGPITLIGDPALGDPSKEEVYSADVYSAAFPEMVYAKVSPAQAWRVHDELKKAAADVNEDGALDVLRNYMLGARPDPKAALQKLNDSDMLGVAYLRATGRSIDVPRKPVDLQFGYLRDPAFRTWWQQNRRRENFVEVMDELREQLGQWAERRIAEMQDEVQGGRDAAERLFPEIKRDRVSLARWDMIDRDYRNLTETEVDSAKLQQLVREADPNGARYEWAERLLDVFGTPKIKVGRRLQPANLSTLVEVMTRGSTRAKEKGITFGAGQVKAHAATRFQSLDELRAMAHRIIPTVEYFAAKRTLSDRLDVFRTKALESYTRTDWRGNIDTWSGLDDVHRSLAGLVKRKRPTTAQAAREFVRHGFRNVPDEVLVEATKLAQEFRQHPARYFEAKPQRAVSLSEFRGAVIPVQSSDRLREALRSNNVPFVEYDETYTEDAGGGAGAVFPSGRERVTKQFIADLDTQRPLLFQNELLPEDTPSSSPVLFYSALERAVEALPATMTDANAEEWRRVLRSWVDSGVVKQQELFWTGLQQFIDAKIAEQKATSEQVALVETDEATGEVTMRRVSREKAAEMKRENPEREFEEIAEPRVTKREVQSWLRGHAVAVEATTVADVSPPVSWGVYEGGTLTGTFETEDLADEAASEAIENNVNYALSRAFLDSVVTVVETDESAAYKSAIDELETFSSLAIVDEPLLTFEEWRQRVLPEGATAGSVWLAINQGLLGRKSVPMDVTDAQVERLRARAADENSAQYAMLQQAYSLPSADGPADYGYVERWKAGTQAPDAPDAPALTRPQGKYRVNIDNMMMASFVRSLVDWDRYDDVQDKTYETEDAARAAADELHLELSAVIEEGARDDAMQEIAVHEAQGPDPTPEFESWTAGGPKQGYGEVAIVMPVDNPKKAKFNAEDVGHTFGGPETDLNRLAHFRYTLRKSSAGEDVMLIEEVQSDWADAVRNAGLTAEGRTFAEGKALRDKEDAAKTAAARQLDRMYLLTVAQVMEDTGIQPSGSFFQGHTPASLRQLANKLNFRLVDHLVTSASKTLLWEETFGPDYASLVPQEALAEYQRLTRESDIARAAARQTRVPATLGPFVHSTDAWVGLTLKHALQFAATKLPNVTRIALANGAENAQTFSVAHAMDTMRWAPQDAFKTRMSVSFIQRSRGQDTVTVDTQGVVIGSATMGGVLGKHLRELVGKELADLVLANFGSRGEQTNLGEVGGIGMRTFYGNEQGYQTNTRGEVQTNAEGKPLPAIVPKVLRDLTKELDVQLDDVEGLTAGAARHLSFPVTPRLRAQLSHGFPLFQQERGAFDPESNTIFLNPQADPTTVLHEMSHFWLSTLFRTADAPTASEGVRKDAQTVLSWFGVKDLEAWKALTFEQQRKHHEAWAYNAEAHFFGEGKAPTTDEEQLRMFRAFGRYVRAVYRNVRDVLNKQYQRLFKTDLPGLTPDVRAVFDRMVASEEAVEAARAERALDPMLRERPEDMPAEEWESLQKAHQDATDAAIDDVQRQVLQSFKWVGDNESRIARQLQRATRDARRRIEKQERDKLGQEKIYRAIQQLRYGTLDQDGQSRPFKLNLEELRSTPLGDDTRVAKFGVGASGMLAADGLSLDIAAQLLGYETGLDLVRALDAAPPLEDAVQQRADQRMLAEHTDLTDPTKLRAVLENAVHNEAGTRVVAAELRWLSKAAAPVQMMTRAAREHARDVIGKMEIGKVRPHQHALAETRNRREALRELGKGNRERAASFKRRELLENQMEREALAVREEIAKTEKLVKKLFKSDEKLGATRSIDHVAVARYLASAFGLSNRDAAADTYVEQLRAYNPEMFEMLQPQIEQARVWAARAQAEGRQITSWRKMTVDEFRDLSRALTALWEQSRREKQVVIDGRAMDLENVAGDILEQSNKLPPGPPTPAGSLTPGEGAVRGWWRLKHLATRPEHWALRKDGGDKPGVFTRYFWRPVRDAVNKYVTARNRYTKRIVGMVQTLRPKLRHGLIEFRDAKGNLLHVFGRGNGGFGQAELVAALLHTGNAGNLERLIAGRGWGKFDPTTDTLDTRAWDAFVRDMIAKGYITREVMDFVQSVWDLNEEVKPLAQNAHRSLFGFYFDEITAVPVTMPWGTYRGGYMPAKLDSTALSFDRVEALKDREADFRKQFATTGRGFTKARAAHFAEPLLLDLDLVPAHIDDVLRFSYLQPVVRDVEKVAKHKAVFAALESQQPGVWANVLLPWLQRTASQSISKAGKSRDIDGFWRAVRSNAGVATMFANIPNALQQLTGVIVAAARVRPKYLMRGFWRLLTERGDLFTDIAAESSFMANRQKNQTFESLDQFAELTRNRSKLAKAQAWTRRHGYFLQSALQNLTDSVVWSGAYEQTLAELGPDVTDAAARREAVQRADAAVRQTQSSFDPTDVAHYEEGTPFYRVFTMFSGYFNTLANLQADRWTALSQRAGWAKAGSAFALYALTFAAPALLAEAITRTLRGQWEDEDEDGDVDVLTLDYLFGSQLRSAIAEVPVAGPGILAPMLNAFDNKPYNDRMTTSPAISVLERSFGGTADAILTAIGARVDRKGNVMQVDGQNVRDPITLLGLLFGLPGAAVGGRVGYAVDLLSGAAPEVSAGGAALNLLTGTIPR